MLLTTEEDSLGDHGAHGRKKKRKAVAIQGAPIYHLIVPRGQLTPCGRSLNAKKRRKKSRKHRGAKHKHGTFDSYPKVGQ